MDESDQSVTSDNAYDLGQRIAIDDNGNRRKRGRKRLDRRRSKRRSSVPQEFEQKNVSLVNRPLSGKANTGVDEFGEKAEISPTTCAQSTVITERKKESTNCNVIKECNNSYDDTSMITAQGAMEDGHRIKSDFHGDCHSTRPTTNATTNVTTTGQHPSLGELNTANDNFFASPSSTENLQSDDRVGDFVHHFRDDNDSVVTKITNESWYEKKYDNMDVNSLMAEERTVECLKREREEKHKEPKNQTYKNHWKHFCDWVKTNEVARIERSSVGSYLTRTNVDGYFRFIKEMPHYSKASIKQCKTALQWYASNACANSSGFIVNSPIVEEVMGAGLKKVAQEVPQNTELKDMKSTEARARRSVPKYQYREEDQETLVEELEREEIVPVVPIAPSEPVKFDLVKDPNKHYIEEEAHLYHNPPIPSERTEGITPGELVGIPPPQPLPKLPSTGKCHWKFDEKQRVLLADFAPSQPNNEFAIDKEDEKFFLQMLERNDITVISEGLISAKAMDPEVWKLQHLQSVLGQEYYHKFRRFDTYKNQNGFETCREIDGLYSMKIGDYIAYLSQRCRHLAGNGEDPKFTFIDCEGKENIIDDVKISAIYMIDLDINKSLPDMHSNFMECFRYPAVLPGGSYCMMNSVTPNARPFMGPNMYITPPAAFTHFHQDGHGTVDSGHFCLKGYNEVILLRRLTERHKKHALMILTGDFLNNGDKTHDYFDALYQVPHGDELGEKPAWPTKEQIEKCRQMGYCPTVVIIKPGQLIHINKGRLHAFRKMSPSPLPSHDCHEALREELIKERNITGEELCISIAWDWMFKGVTSAGINREVLSVLEASILNRKRGKMSLAIPEMALLQMAKFTPPIKAVDSVHHMGVSGMVGFIKNGQDIAKGTDARITNEACLGILPGLRHVVKEHVNTMEIASREACQSLLRGKRVTISKRPNTHENPSSFPVDPYGNNDFFCKLCNQELSNVYFHCDGCEQLLSKDFNICRKCHAEKMFCQTIQMHPSNPKRHSTLNHTGRMNYDRGSRCPCRNGPACKICHFCSGCSCRCHTWFTLHYRLFNKDEETALLARVEAATKAEPVEPDDPFHRYLDQAFTEARLENASRKYD